MVAFTVTAVNTRFLFGREQPAMAQLRSVGGFLERELAGRARQKAAGGVQRLRTGRHAAAIKSRFETTLTSVRGTVWSDAPGAGLLEYGGRLPARTILPDRARVLRFMGSAGAVFASVVHVPEAIVGPHSALHAAFDEMRARITTGLTQAGEGFWTHP